MEALPLAKSKQPSLIIDSVIKSLEAAISDLKALNGEASDSQPTEKKSAEKKPNNVKSAIDVFTTRYYERFGSFPYISKADAVQLGRLFELSDFEQIVAGYLNLDDPFVVKNGYSARFIPSKVDAIRQSMKPTNSSGQEWK